MVLPLSMMARGALAKKRSSGGGATLWTPAALGSRLYAWWDFSDSAALTIVGGEVSSVALKAGTAGTLPLTGFHDGSTSYRPIVHATAFNGRPSLSIADKVLYNDAINVGTTTAMAYFGSVYLTAGQWQGRIASFGPGSAWDDGNQQGFMMHTTGSTVEVYRDNFGGANGWTDTYPGAHAYSARFPSTGNGYIDREMMNGEGVITASAATLAPTRFAIGGSTADKYANHLAANAYYRQSVIIIGDVTTDEQQRLFSFLAWDGGYQSQLEASNPYKAAPPNI